MPCALLVERDAIVVGNQELRGFRKHGTGRAAKSCEIRLRRVHDDNGEPLRLEEVCQLIERQAAEGDAQCAAYGRDLRREKCCLRQRDRRMPQRVENHSSGRDAAIRAPALADEIRRELVVIDSHRGREQRTTFGGSCVNEIGGERRVIDGWRADRKPADPGHTDDQHDHERKRGPPQS